MCTRLHFLLTLLAGVFAVGSSSVQADDADAVKEKLFQAKKAYDTEVQKFKKAVSDLLDKREDTERKPGNKKAVDQIKAERAAFEKNSEIPSMIPLSMRDPVNAARVKVDKAYSAAIREYVRLKMDDAAGTIEKEQQEFVLGSALMFGKRTYLTTLKHFDVKVWNNRFAINGTDMAVKIKVNEEYVPHTIFIHPPEKGYSQVKYTLGEKWTALQATIGVPKIKDEQRNPFSPLTFEVKGDGKTLWKSEPVAEMNTFQKCTVLVNKVKVLTLQAHCEGSHVWAHAVWVQPILAE